ncbi:MAG TPA: type II secretion system protein, partial [Sediminibacterium sp.]|uniref:pilus assembly FimT family protein n=1 Tax=Sediminibacterium sp. TaxID=1917865 RepID=UPI002B4AFD17
MLRPKQKTSGFSLVETIIYLAIVGILLVAVLNFHFSLSGTSAKLWAKINVSENRRFVLQTIDYLSRNSTGLLKDVNG